jgi:CRP/FNR family transcriptional regulator, cyclic AMP receptor protein
VASPEPWPRSSLLSRLSEAEAKDLLSAGTHVAFGRGDNLLRQGEPGGTLFMLLSGYAKVTATAIGGDVILALRGRGDIVGEFTVIDERTRTATVTALGALTAIRVGRARFLEFCDRHPAANRKIMQSLTDKLRRTSELRAVTRAAGSRARLAQVMYEVAIGHGIPQRDGVIVMPPLTQADLGDLAGVAGSTVERVLKELRDEGIVLSRYRRTSVLNIEALRTMAAEL